MVNLMNIMIPAYAYPLACDSISFKTDNCAWGGYFRGIEANKGYFHTVIINPNSGPGPNYQYPDDTWKFVIDKLNSYNNTRVIGYVDSWPDANVDTGTNPRRPKIEPSTYIPQIATYVNWANLTGYDLHMDGIFVDDMTADNASRLQYYQTFANNIKSTFPATYRARGVTYNYEKYITVNPGQPINCQFYGNVSSVVTFEGYYRDWSTATFKDAAYNACPRVKQTVLIHDYTGSATDQQQLCDDAGETYRIGNFYVTDKVQIDSQNINPYDSISTLWGYFTSSVTATNSWISAHPQWYSP